MGSLLLSFLTIILFAELIFIIYLNSKDREKIQKLEDEISSMEDLLNLKNQEIAKKKQELKELLDQLDPNDPAIREELKESLDLLNPNDPDSKELRDKILYKLESE